MTMVSLAEKRSRRSRGVVCACLLIALTLPTVLIAPSSVADPGGTGDVPYYDEIYDYNPDAFNTNNTYDKPVAPLPMFVATPSNWQPKFPFPYDQTKGSITDADINAQREMCQWFNAQYYELRRQIDKLQFDRITPNGPGVIIGSGSDWDYSRDGLQQEADIVIANIDQSLNFLAPRVNALTQATNHFNDLYFPLYQGEAFFRLWQQLSNVSAGIKSHQPGWFSGPSVQVAKNWGTKIERSHVCS